MPSRQEVKEAVYIQIERLSSVSRSEISPDSNLKENIGMDSLDVIELCMECENHYNIRIGEEEEERLQGDEITVNDLINAVCDRLNIS